MNMDKDAFLIALRKAECGLAGCAAGPNAEIYNCFRLVPGHICAFNNDIAVDVPFDHVLDCTVPAAELRKILEKSKAQNVDITVTDQELQIIGKNFVCGLPLKEAFQLPPSMKEAANKLVPLPASFIEAMGCCVLSVYRGKDRADLNCIHITKAYMESCDNYRITRFYWPENYDFPGECLIPLSVAKQLLSHRLSNIFVDEGCIIFEDETGMRIFAKTVDYNYPNMENFISTTGPEIEFPADIDALLERAEVFVSDESDDTGKAYLCFSKGNLTIYMANSAGWLKETSRIVYDHDNAAVAVSPTLLRTVIKKAKTFQLAPKAMKFSTPDMDHLVSFTDVSEEELQKRAKRIKK